MRIVFTGGGTGGHFYPHIAVAEAIRAEVAEQKLVDPVLYYLAEQPYDKRALFDNGIKFKQIPAGKIRRYFSVKNFSDIIKTITGVLIAVWKMYWLYPDVVFSKGGYDSFPTVWAARFFKIPVIIHESDSKPGRVNEWAGKFATRIAVSYPDALKYFPADKSALTGNPIRTEILTPVTTGAHEFLKLDANLPVILVLGGSQGASVINDTILDTLPELVSHYQIIHQTGQANFTAIDSRARFILENNKDKAHYRAFNYLNDTALKMAAGAATIVVSRAGSQIFEIANWGLPSIIIPIPEEVSHDQRTNAFTYARSGGAVVIEEKNLTPSILLSEINRLVSNPKLLEDMKKGAATFARPDAAATIAKVLLAIALSHEA